MTTGAALLADIGGTNARFAVLREGVRGEVLRLATADFPDLPAALAHALGALDAGPVDAIAMCAAGPPADGRIAMTNCPWQVGEAALRGVPGVTRVLLVNDFTALAAALPALPADSLDPVGGARAAAGAPLAVLGPGTGLGVSGHLPGPGAGVQITGEGGHVDLPSAGAHEDRIVERLRARCGHVSAETVLSGAGLGRLHSAMAAGDAPPAADPTPQRISADAARGDPRALACVRQFCAFLGAVAGNLALTLGARGGVYLGGGIVPGWGALFDRDAFRERFEDKGSYREYLRPIPVYIIREQDPALRGLARLLAHHDAHA